MSEKLKIFNCVVLLLISRLGWTTPIEIRFENLKTLIEKQNSNIQSAQLELQASKERTRGLSQTFLPQLEVYGSHESFKTGVNPNELQPSFGAELKMNVFKGGRDQIDSKIKKLEYERKAILFQETKADELEEARKVFWKIVYLQEKMRLLNDAIDINFQNLKSAARRIRSGVATESDRVEFEMKAVELKREFLQTELSRDNQIRDFSILLSFDISQKIYFTQKLEHSHDYENQLNHEVKDHEFRYKSKQLLAQQEELKSISQKRTLWPELEVFAAYNEYNQRIESAGPDSNSNMRKESVYGLRMKIDFGNVIDSANEARAQALDSKAELKKAEFKKQQVEFHVENEMAELHFLHDQIHDAEENIVRAEKYYKLTQSEYSRGVKNSPDVLGASEKLLQNRLKRIEIVKDFQIAKAHVMSKIGK
jgi:outer membrane protein